MVKGTVIGTSVFNLSKAGKDYPDPIVLQLCVANSKQKTGMVKLVELTPASLKIQTGDVVWWSKGILYWVEKGNPHSDPVQFKMVVGDK